MKILPFIRKFLGCCDGVKLANGVVYLWLVTLLAVPLFWVIALGFAKVNNGLFPYQNLVLWGDGFPALNLTMDNFRQLVTVSMYGNIFLNSLYMATFVTLLLIPIAYSIAYSIYNLPYSWRYMVLFIVVMPCCISSLVRNYTLIFILGKKGILNVLLMHLGLISNPVSILYTKWAVFIGVFYSYLPFMLLPIYANLEKIDDSLVDTANILGCSPFKAFWIITFRLSIYGVITGCLLIFISVMGEMLIPLLLGGGDVVMLGNAIWEIFFVSRDWPTASAIASLMLGMLFFVIFIMRKVQGKYTNV